MSKTPKFYLLTSYKQPPLMLFRVKLFWERLLEKMCTQQSSKYGIWYDQYTVSWHCSCWTYFCCVALLLTNIHVYHPWSLVPLFLISLNNSELKTTHKSPFGIVTCTFSDNLSQNSCISRISCDNAELYLHVTCKLHSLNNLLIIIKNLDVPGPLLFSDHLLLTTIKSLHFGWLLT